MSRVLNIGELELADFMGSDLSVARAARISNGVAMPEWRGEPDERLIRFLAEHHHTSPFEHVVASFFVRAPIFVAREWMRHRTLSYNEMSARYRQLEPTFYFPTEARIPDPNNKQSSVPAGDPAKLEFVRARMQYAYKTAWDSYTTMLGAGIAREMARSVLPVGIYTEFIVTGNLLNWLRFYQLRKTVEAQYEIREYANAIGELLSNRVPLSFAALAANL